MQLAHNSASTGNPVALVRPLVGHTARLIISDQLHDSSDTAKLPSLPDSPILLQSRLSQKPTYKLVVLIRQPAILLVLLVGLLLQCVKVPALSALNLELRFELLDRLAQLLRFARRARLLGRLLLQSGERFLDVDKVEDDVKDAREEEG
jgi:hypothetical protein